MLKIIVLFLFLKSSYFSFRDKRICPDRHHVNLEIDMPRKLSNQALPTFGYIKVSSAALCSMTNGHFNECISFFFF